MFETDRFEFFNSVTLPIVSRLTDFLTLMTLLCHKNFKILML